ncbi:MAG: ATP-binding protein [Gammaproteobacteria bacterium]|nr:MAG: ATP-binding protein [Gammaproteobacteria bacterium]
MFKRKIYTILLHRLQEPRRFIQVLTGPRQVGKTTLVQQVAEELNLPTLYASADEPTLRSPLWIEQQWELARLELKSNSPASVVLILDEIQKITNWSDSIKRLWDEDTRAKRPLLVVLLGSAPLLVQRGLTESLAGRFEQIPVTHWSWQEMHEAFGWSLEQYIYFGGYPGAASLIGDETRFRHYINDSLIETTLSRDILLLNPIHKPALLRRLFELACHYSSQLVSYQKMLGQLQDAGNTTTLAHYLDLLKGVGMAAGVFKFSNHLIRQRSSSPKLQVFNTALLSTQSTLSFHEAQKDRTCWGRLVESAIGAFLLNSAITHDIKVFYWREGGKEVDFVLQSGKKIIAIEVKSGMMKEALPGMETFIKHFQPLRSLVIGGANLSIEKFFQTPITDWFAD